MEDVVYKNIENRPMNYSPQYVLGEVAAPDDHYKPVLYSHYGATKDFNRLNQDIYEKREQNKPIDRPKTPKGIIALLIAGGLYGGYKLVRHLIKK